MADIKYTWIQTHKDINKYLLTREDKQKELIDLLKSVGIDGFIDRDKNGKEIDLEEIDPFSFYCYIYKHGAVKRLDFLQKVAKEIGAYIPEDESGLPSTNAQKVWLFPYKFERVNSEVKRLWSFFKKEQIGQINDEDFEDVLKIKGAGKTKLTEALFYVNPEKYLPIDGPTKPYLKEELDINPDFDNFSQYLNILENVKSKTSEPFYEISDKAWIRVNEMKQINYWVFQANPKIYDVLTALKDNAVTVWSVKAHSKEIKTGDKIILWVSGDMKGCYALGEVNSDIYEGQDDEDQMRYYTDKSKDELSTRVRVNITHNLFNRPITKEQIEENRKLSDLKIGLQGTNFSATEEQYKALLKMAEQNSKCKYWLYAPGENARLWDEFYENQIMGLGWDQIGDLNNLKSKEDIRKKLQETGDTENNKKNDTKTLFQFKNDMSPGDIVISKKGRKEYLGYGIVTSDYYYDPKRNYYKKCRKVNWQKEGLWEEEGKSIPIKTLSDITGNKELVGKLVKLIGIEESIEINHNNNQMSKPYNQILYGPPGTGKTYETILRAAEIIEDRKISDYDEALKVFKDNLHDRIEFITFHQNYSYEDFIQGLRPDIENEKELTFERKDGVFKIIADKALKNLRDSINPLTFKKPFEEVFNTFISPLVEEDKEIEVKMKKVSYYITSVSNKSISFRKASGGTAHTLSISTLKKMYEEESVAEIQGLAIYYAPLVDELLRIGKDSAGKKVEVRKKNYVIVIDEINRANISRVFGELITLIEEDKRSHGKIPMEAILPSGDSFIVPSNLYIIGTMNTADKSIALLDIALRRRFEFEPIYPKYEIKGHIIYDVEILKKLNEEIILKKGHDFQIGHSYFMNEKEDLVYRMNKKVIPLLQEYFMNDIKEVKEILKKAGLNIDNDSFPIRITGKS